jgi:hypothetical protein
VADQVARFAVELDASDVEDGAESAADSLAKLRTKIEDETKALREMQAAMGRLKGSSNDVIAAKKELQTKIAASRESLAKAQASYLKGGGALSDIGKKATDAGKAVEKNGMAQQLAGKASEELSAKVAGAGGSLGKFAQGLGRLGPYVAAIVAVLALTVGFAALAVGMADTSRSARLVTQAMAGSEQGGAKLGGRIDALSKSLPITKAALVDISRALTDKGLQGASLEYALGAIARTTSVLGATAGGKIQAIAEKSKELKKFTAQALDFTGTGITIDDVAASLAKRTKTSLAAAKESIKAGAVDLATGLEALDAATKKKLGGVADKMNISLSSIFERGKSGLGSIFAGIDIEPLLQGLSDVVGLLDSSSASGKALRAIAEVALQPLITFVGGQGQSVVGFFETLVIGALLVAIAVVRAKNAVKAFGKDAKESIGGFADKMVSVGTDMIDGLVKGIKAGAEKVAKALTAVVDDAVKSAKEALGIASPSKVFAEIGRHTIEGYEQGVEEAAPSAKAATEAAIAPPAAATAPGAGSRGATIVFQPGAIQINGVTGADDPSFEAKLVAALRRALQNIGEPLPLTGDDGVPA